MLSLSDSISSANFKSLMVEWLPKIETQLKEELPSNNADPIWQKAVTSAIFNGGKRTRPFLTILGWQTVAKNSSIQEEMVLRIAVAIELIHSSSLIFDDLPCMDNATIRRGNQALHLEFGEDKAILVALSLLLKGIEIVIKTLNSLEPGNQAQSLVIDLMHSLGERGLICGQWFDLSAKQSITSQEKNNALAPLRNLKTMPLIRFALLSGAVLGKATEEQKNVLAKFAELIGEAYQQIDDLLDFISDPDTLGKDVALDKKNDRLNYAYINLDKTILNIEEKLNQARNIILEENYSYNLEKTYLVAFTYYLNNRFQKALSYRSS
ncbi:MAG: polyprenyl synthetase family protein [Acidobacteria bacterium]|nr:polyprenyl synthetase family protein [Acidobacteriota bacterium]